MKSLLNKRLQGILVAVLVTLVAGATSVTTASASPAATDGATASANANSSALKPKQKKAKRKALKRCKKGGKARNRKARKRQAKKRRNCIKKVKKKYRKISKRNKNRGRKGKTKVVDVMDNWYAPDFVKLKVNDKIKWDWQFSTSSEGHNVSLMQGPKGVSPFDFESPIQTGPNATFKRQFKKPGNYNLFCTLHTEMRMSVKVTK